MNIYMRMLSSWFVLLLGVVSLGSAAKTFASEDSNSEIKGAACIIRADNKVVLVHEIITKKLSLPAGRVEKGEDPAIAAQRETWEETGLVVQTKGVLGRSKDAIFYDCVSESDIVSFQFNNVHDGFELPIWFAPHYGIEISSAMLVDPSLIPVDEYRFPEQRDWVKEIAKKATDQSVVYVGNLVEAAPSFNQVELNWMLHFQHAIISLPDSIRDTVRSFLMSGNILAQPFLLIVLLPLVYLKYGKHFTYKIFFAITITSLMSLIAQQGFSFPRPHVYLPAVELVQTYGYSFPSTPAAIWLCVGVLILHAENKLNFNQHSIGFALFIVWLGVAKFYTGSAFFIDILSGALLGFLCSWHIIRLESKPGINAIELLSSKVVWLMLMGMCLVMGVFWPSPVVGYWLAIIITVLFLIFTLKESQGVVAKQTVLLVMLSLLGLNFVISLFANYVSHSTSITLAVEAMRYPLLIVLFVLAIRKNLKAA